MRLLLDESVPSRLRRSLPMHDVRTVVEMGWSGVKNGRLLALASHDFDAFITVDKNLQYQQNLAALPVAVVVLDSPSIELSALLPLIPQLLVALTALEARSFVRISADA
jgi:predicted nuclease of predicted toxin-antitoxin system